MKGLPTTPRGISEAVRRSAIDYLVRSRDAVDAAIADPEFIATIAAIVDRVVDALASGHKLLLAGNGGSAADAQHIAGEFLSRLHYDRAPVAAVALTADSSVMTAIGNDYGFEHLFERQVLGLGREGDVLIAISTSGRSPNILQRAACGAAQRPHRGRLYWKRRRRHAGALRSVPARAIGLDPAYPTASHHRRAHNLRARRSAALPARSGARSGRMNAPPNPFAARSDQMRSSDPIRLSI